MGNWRHLWVFFICFLVFTNLSDAQDIKNLSNTKLLQTAEEALVVSDYVKVIECYEEYLNRKPTSTKVGFELASVYLEIRDYESAMRWYKLLYEQDVNRNILALLSFGKAAMESGDVNLAKRSFDRFNREFDPGKDKNYIKKLNGNYIDGVNLFMSDFDSLKVNYESTLDLNGVYNHPFIDGKRIVFLGEKFKWQLNSIEGLLDLLNKDEASLPNIFFTQDNEKFFFSKYDKNPKGEYVASLYSCIKKDGEWADCVKLPQIVNHEEFNSLLPAVSQNSKNGETIIYFVSDRPEGKGGWDIWYTEYNSKKGSYREAKNLGSKVNTAGNEFSPYYDNEEGVLYFSSDGWPGFGGYDIFWIKGEGRSWEDFYNLGTEINTNYDEYYFIQYQDAYFWASNRNSSRNIYSPHFYDEFYKTRFLTRIREESLTAKLETGKENQVDKKNDIEIDDEVSEEKTIKEESNFNIEQVSDSIIKITLYHEFDEIELVDEFLPLIDTFIVSKIKTPGFKSIKITSYTDNLGTEAYNKVLSTNRAIFTKDYIVSKGVAESIIECSGKGEAGPEAPNNKEDGSDNPAGRKLNRRTIIEAIIN